MKRCLFALITLALLLTFAACADVPATVEEPPAPEPELVVEPTPVPEPFPGRIAIITSAVDGNEEEYRSAEQVLNKYGEKKIVIETWPANFMQEQEQMKKIVAQVAADPEVKALIINQAVPGVSEAVAKLRQIREDIFVVFCQPQEDPDSVTKLADLLLSSDALGMGPAMARQAQKLGAKTFVHYSFPRHMTQPLLATQRDLIKEACAELGIAFVDATAPDPTSDVGVAGAQQFILEDVPKMVAKYGADTAFFATNCSMQIPLIKAVAETGAIYPQPCCPSPYHGFPAALRIETPGEGMATTDYMISETTRILGEQGVLGRLSTWPVPLTFLETSAGAEYAVKWINGEVPKEGIDVDALKQIMADYAGVGCFTSGYADEDGMEYFNYLLVREDYITFGQEYITTEASSHSAEVSAGWQDNFLVKDGVLLRYSGWGQDIILPEGITAIADEVFRFCNKIQTITIPNSVTSIGRETFLNCTSLTSINIPHSVTTIEWGAFYGCTKLQSVIIPASVTDIAFDAFVGCDNLTIHCPAGSYAESYAKVNNIPYVIE